MNEEFLEQMFNKEREEADEDKYCCFGCGKLLNEEDGDHIDAGSCAECE